MMDAAVERTNTFGNYLLQGIEEIVLPAEVSWWPTTVGWQIVLMIVLILAVRKAIAFGNLWWKNRYRREALRQLDALRANAEPVDFYRQLPTLLKATALHAYKREDVAAMSGDAWVTFLNGQYAKNGFSGTTGQLLTAISYQPAHQWQSRTADLEELSRQSEIWLRTHKGAEYV